MKKQVKKDKYTVTEVGTLIEALRSEFRPFVETIPGMQKKLDSIYEQVGKNTEKIDRILEELKSKVDHKNFDVLEKKVAVLAG